MSPFRLVVTTMSNWAGCLASWWATLSMIRCSDLMSGYSSASSSKTFLKRPSVIFMMLALVAAVTLRAALSAGQLEGVADHLLGALPADHLEALADVGRDHVLDPGVQVLDVLADDDHVHAFAGVAGRDARQLTRRTDVGVRLEELAQGDVGALLAEADRRLERALQDDLRALDRVAGLGRHARACRRARRRSPRRRPPPSRSSRRPPRSPGCPTGPPRGPRRRPG